jgi:endonuclease YncB( thermonuclease family)
MALSAASITGVVVGVSDGDTMTVLVDSNKTLKIRLAGIDAPERLQPFGSVSKTNLSSHVFGKTVTVEWDKKDKYGRVIGRVLVEGVDVCLEQIKSGLAWHYKQYAKEQGESLSSAYSAAEQQARIQMIGIWSESKQTPPWEYRHSEKRKHSN